MRAFCVTWERRAVGNGCFFSILVGFERRASNGVKRAFFVVQVKEKRQAVSSGRLNGVLSEGKAEMNIYAEDE